MKELHYTPSQTARNLSMKSSSTVGVIVPEISNTFFGELFSGVEEITKRHNLSLLYSGNDNDMDTDYKALDMMKMQRVRGLLYIPAVNYSALGVLDKLQRKLDRMNCPIVCMDRDIGLKCDIIHFIRREMLDFTAFPVFFVSNLLLVQRKKYYFNRAMVSRNCSIVL